MNGRWIFAAVAATMVCAVNASAVEKCSVKVDKKTGLLVVSAGGVAGTLHWGGAAGAETETFFNAGSCVADGKATKCQLADPTTLAAKTPPAGCTIYLDDDGAPCSAWIAGCTPGARSEAAAPVCGDGQAATGEDCDGSNLKGQTCQSAGFLYGTLACAACALDTTGCTNARFHDNGDGTITDHQTKLMWEKKTGTYGGSGQCPQSPACSSVHDVRNQYSWSDGASHSPDGWAFFIFLAELNGVSPFAGHDDWRLPTLPELSTLVDMTAFDCFSFNGPGCMDPIFGPNQARPYWTSTTDHRSPDDAWVLDFSGQEFVDTGLSSPMPKSSSFYVRAVRSVP